MNQPNQRRFRWACRRGMLELDLFLLPFYEKYGEKLSHKETEIFWSLLNESDPDLFSWLMGNQVPTNTEYLDIVDKIRTHKRFSN